MKTMILLAAVSVIVACQPTSPDQYLTDSEEIQLAKNLVNSYELGDWDQWVQIYADSARIFHNSMTPVTKDELRDGFVAGLASYSDYGFKGNPYFYEMIIDDKGEKWVYFWGTWSGTFKESDETIYVPVHLALNFENGKIKREHAYYDRSQIVQQQSTEEAVTDSEIEETTE